MITLVNQGNFQIFIKALKAADLFDGYRRGYPLTVFAPTDEAFAKLPPGTLDNLLKPENKPELIQLLVYHVLTANSTVLQFIAKELPMRFQNYALVPIVIAHDGYKLQVNDALVIKPDMLATNGFVHAIDTVLIPPPEVVNLLETAAVNDIFRTFLTAVLAADLIRTFQSDGPFTLFAPTDDAFAKLPPGTLENLLKLENKPALVEILKYHVVRGNLSTDDIIALHLPTKLETLAGRAVVLNDFGGPLKVNDATVSGGFIATNGYLLEIDQVLLPPSFTRFGPRPFISIKKPSIH